MKKAEFYQPDEYWGAKSDNRGHWKNMTVRKYLKMLWVRVEVDIILWKINWYLP